MNIVNSLRSAGLVGSRCTLKTSFRPRTPLDLESCNYSPGKRRGRQDLMRIKVLPCAERYFQPVVDPKGSDGMVASISMILPFLTLNTSGMSVSKGRRVAPEYFM